MEEPKVIQNAIYIIEEDRVVASTHRHHFHPFAIHGNLYAIDGGCDYIRWIGDVQELINSHDIINLNLVDTDNIAYMSQRLIWGTHPSQGQVKYKRLIDLSTEHLRNIVNTQKVSKRYEDVIEYILVSRLP